MTEPFILTQEKIDETIKFLEGQLSKCKNDKERIQIEDSINALKY